MKCTHTILFLFVLPFIFISCHTSRKQDKVLQVLDIIEANSIQIDSIDWKKIKEKTLHEIRKERKDTNVVIEELVKQLHDKHSFYLPKEKATALTTNDNLDINIKYELLNETTGYVKIPSFTGKDSLACAFAQQILDKIILLDTHNVNSWIIDLRTNTGGNMWPMLLGLHPLLDDGIKGYFIQRNDTLSWSIEEAKVLYQDQVVMHFSKAYILKNKPRKIAVLLSEKTCSSGEALAISFATMKNVTFIGNTTCGLTTGNSAFILHDGSVLGLTTSIFADSDKKTYPKAVTPDLFSKQPKKEALLWIREYL